MIIGKFLLFYFTIAVFIVCSINLFSMESGFDQAFNGEKPLYIISFTRLTQDNYPTLSEDAINFV
ncbi:MAG: hypothetical protein ACTSXG_03620, partial [Alphaproteobacteria bacterium]